MTDSHQRWVAWPWCRWWQQRTCRHVCTCRTGHPQGWSDKSSCKEYQIGAVSKLSDWSLVDVAGHNYWLTKRLSRPSFCGLKDSFTFCLTWNIVSLWNIYPPTNRQTPPHNFDFHSELANQILWIYVIGIYIFWSSYYQCQKNQILHDGITY